MKRKRFSEEQIVRIVRAVEQSGKAVPGACREQGTAENTYYRWRRKYGGASVPEVRRLRELEKENARLERLVAERDLEIDTMQELLKGNW